MHLIDIILISGAIACFSIAFLIASKPVKKRKGVLKSQVKNWTHVVNGKKADIVNGEVFHVLNDETQ